MSSWNSSIFKSPLSIPSGHRVMFLQQEAVTIWEEKSRQRMKARRRFYCHAFVTSEPACVALCSDVIEPWGSLDDDSRFEYLCRGSDKNWYAGQYKVLLYVLSPTVSFHYLASLVLLSHVLLLYSSNCLLYLEVHLKGGFQGQINIYLSN